MLRVVPAKNWRSKAAVTITNEGVRLKVKNNTKIPAGQIILTLRNLKTQIVQKLYLSVGDEAD